MSRHTILKPLLFDAVDSQLSVIVTLAEQPEQSMLLVVMYEWQ